MQMERISRYLGLSRRAGKIIPGYRSCSGAVKAGKIKLLIAAEDISENTKDKFSSQCKNHNVPFYVCGTIEELSAAVGMTGVGIFGVTDSNLAKAIKKEIEMDR